jgi:hypothetical protein
MKFLSKAAEASNFLRGRKAAGDHVQCDIPALVRRPSGIAAKFTLKQAVDRVQG